MVTTTEGMTFKQVIEEMVQIVEAKNDDNTYHILRRELKKGLETGMLTESLYRKLNGCLQQWWIERQGMEVFGKEAYHENL